MMNPIRAQIRSMLNVQPREGGFRAVFNVRPDLEIFPDHFRDGMILPGICMVQAVLAAGAQIRGVDNLSLRVLKNAKMLAPVLPGDEVTIDADMTADPSGDIAIKARFLGPDKCRAEISLVAVRPARDGGCAP